MKRKVCLLFTFVVMMCLMACLSINVSAAEIESTGQCGENAYWSFDKSTRTLTISGTGKIDDAVFYYEETGEMLIDENTGDPVWNMPWYDFKNEIYTLVIEEGITEIGAFAFYSFYFLTEVDFPSTLEVVGCAAFCDCISLVKLDFPDSVHTLYVSNYNEIAIKKIVLPVSLETTPTIPGIDEIFDFNMCAYLESLTIPEEIGAVEVTIDSSNPSIRNIYNYSAEAIVKFDEHNELWYGDEATAEYMTVSIGAALASIEYEMTEEEQEAFVLEKIIEYYGEDYAEKIPEPVLIETVPDYIKVYCYENSAQHLYCVENNINFVLIDENTHLDSNNDCICDICGLKHMCGEKVYYQFDEETDTLTIKGEGNTHDEIILVQTDFEPNNRVQHIIIEENITSISDYIFRPFDNLRTLSISSTVTHIEGRFYDYDMMEKFVVAEDNPVYSTDEYGVLFNKDKTVLIRYPRHNTSTKYYIPDSVKTIEEFSIHLCDFLEELFIGANVSHIERNAFSRNASLKRITVDENNPNFCNDERGALFNEDKTILYQYPLGHSSGSYNIPDTVTKLSGSSFEDARNLTSIVIPVSVTEIEFWVFPGGHLNYIYYTGTEEQWNSIQIDGYNDNLYAATIHFNYDGTEPIITNSGFCGENVVFELYSDGTLIIDGEGPMYDYTSVESPPPYITFNFDEKGETSEYFGDLTIKKVIINDSITRISDHAFVGCRKLEEIEIADTVTSIGDAAFNGCTSLKHIKIPGSVKVIEEEAFCYSALETIEIENGLEQIETCVFLFCRNLKEIILPESVTSIKTRAFIMCDSLETAVVNNKNCEIGECNFVVFELDKDGNLIYDENGFELFGEAKHLTSECPTTLKGYIGSTAETYAKSMTEAGYPIKFESIDVHTHLDSDKNGKCDICGEIFIVDEGNCGAEGDNVTWTFYSDGKLIISGNGAMADNFFEFSKLDIKNVIIESGVTTIGGWAFARCDELVNIEIPDTVTSIGDSTFSGCESLTAVTIPVSVTTIGKAAFFNCKNLGSVAIPAGITSIAELSFCGCKNLTSVTITKSITHIDKTAFDGCTSLADVYYDGTVQDWDRITIKSGNDPLINATKIFGAVCRHTEDGHETVTTEEIIDEPTFFDDGSYAEITKCKNCGAELSREIKTIPDVSLLDTIAEEIEEFFKGPISAIANVFKRILRIFGKR